MKTLSSALVLALFLATPGAYAQNNLNNSTSSSASAFPPQIEQSIQQRMGPEQVPMELAKTSFLNRFGGLGFARVLDMAPQGENYLAHVETIRGNVAAVEINPLSGDIVTMQTQALTTGQQGEPQIEVSDATVMSDRCDMSAWSDLNNAVNQLDPDEELQARRMMLEVWDLHASNEGQACQQQLQQVQVYVRDASAS